MIKNSKSWIIQINQHCVPGHPAISTFLYLKHSSGGLRFKGSCTMLMSYWVLTSRAFIVASLLLYAPVIGLGTAQRALANTQAVVFTNRCDNWYTVSSPGSTLLAASLTHSRILRKIIIYLI